MPVAAEMLSALGDQPSRARQVAQPRSFQRQRLEVDRQLARARRHRGRAGPVARRPRSLRRPTSRTARRRPASPTAGRPRPAVAARPSPRAGGSGIATACPSVISRAKAVEHQVEWMRVRRQRWEGADGAADLEQDVRSAEVVRRDGGTPRGQVGPASEAEVERLEPFRSFEEQRRRLVAVARHDGSVASQERGSRAAGSRRARPASRRGQEPLRRVELAGLEARLRGGQRAPGLERRVGGQRGRPLEERRCGREAAAALRASCGALERRRPRLRRVRRRRVRGARRGGRRRARDRSPPPARRARAVVRRVTRLGTPPSAPAGGGTGHGRRSPAARLPPREPARSGRWRAVRPPATAAWRPPAGPLPPAGSVAASPRAIRRRAAGTAPPADSEDRPPRAARSPRLAPPGSSSATAPPAPADCPGSRR